MELKTLFEILFIRIDHNSNPLFPLESGLEEVSVAISEIAWEDMNFFWFVRVNYSNWGVWMQSHLEFTKACK